MGDYITETGSEVKHYSIPCAVNAKDADESNLNQKKQADFRDRSPPKKPLARTIHNPDQSSDIVDTSG
jgi:hypothetical protein